LRSLLFRLDPELAHSLSLRLIQLAGGIPPLAGWLRRAYAPPAMPVQAFGLSFANPIGLAAGYDKDGLGWRGLACLGFGHIEVGTVTPRPQPGNPRPRLFRLPDELALINRMGFPGKGADFASRQLEGKRKGNVILGVNLGKNKDTPLEEAAGDYVALIRRFSGLADYAVINVSSPNTLGLRRLQGRQALTSLLGSVAQERRKESLRLPILVKVAPDLSDEELENALDAILASGMDGVIATNTTIERPGIRSRLASEAGGLSGAPLRQRSTQMVRQIARLAADRLPIIGVGGVMCAAHVQEKLDAGATLVQVYTGLVYEGPGLVKRILKDL
jgi:dihydroorotate dehydrogenase